MLIAILVAATATLVAGLALWQTAQLRSRMTAVLTNAEGQSLEQTLGRQHKQVAAVQRKLDELTREYERLTTATGLAAQKISIVRFNPFGDTGGDQSFSLAVLDAHNSGYVLSSIHGREGTRVYVKPIDLGTSKYPLSKEEQLSLDQAAKRVPGKQK